MNKGSPNSCIIYCRVSSKEQIDGTSLETQEHACREYASRKNLNVLKVFVELGESAKTANRTEFLKAIEFCAKTKNSVGYFIVYKLDRFSRNQDDHVKVKGLLAHVGTQLRSATETFDETSIGRALEGMLSVFAEFDNNNRRDRTKTGMIKRFQEGVWIWPVPLGFFKPIRGKGVNIAPDPSTAPLIKLCFEEYAKQTHTYRSLANYLDERGLKTRKGKSLTPQLVYKILHNPIYCGRMEMFDDVRMGTFEPIISEALFEACQKPQKLIKARAANNPAFPLRKFVSCTECGQALTGSYSKGKSKLYGYYHHGASTCPKSHGIPKAVLEEQFIKLLDSIAPSPEYEQLFKAIVLDVWQKRQANAEAADRQIQRDLQTLKERRQAIFDQHLKKPYSDDLFTEQMGIVEKQIHEKQLLLSDKWEKDFHINEALHHCFNFIRHASRTWLEASYDNKLRLQRLILETSVPFDGEKFGTPKLSLVFQQKKTPMSESSSLVAPRGIEPLLTA